MSTEIKVHGMEGALVEADWAPLTMDDVRRLLSHFPACGKPTGILNVSPRPFSAAAVVATSGAPVFIKRHDTRVRNRQALLEEHRFMIYLREHGAAVPRVFANALGETAVEISNWTYEVHEAPEFVDLYGDALSWTPVRSREHAHSAGRALANLHRAAEEFRAPRRAPHPLVASFTIFAAEEPKLALNEFIAARPALGANSHVRDHAEASLVILAPFHEELKPLLPALTPLWTHNDLHASNILWSDTGANARAEVIIDFGLCDRTNAVHDLAHAIERNIVEWLALVADPASPDAVPVHLDHLHALLDGYESVRPLREEEAEALAPMTALCHAEFALSEADYFLGILHSEEKAAMAHDGWLVGHARWFRGEAGKQLLDALRPRPRSRKRKKRHL